MDKILRILVFISFAVAGWPAQSAIVHVQGCVGGSATGGTTVTCTLSAVGNGDIVAGQASWSTNPSQTLSSITDDKSNVYNIVDNLTDGNNPFAGATFYLGNITNSPTVITATFSGSSAFTTIVADEYSGVATSSPLDVHAVQTQNNPTGANSVSSGAATPVANGELIYVATVNSGTDGAAAHGTGFTLRQSSLATGNDFQYSEDLIQTTAASVSGTFTPSVNDTWVTGMMAFKAQGSGGLMLLGCCE